MIKKRTFMLLLSIVPAWGLCQQWSVVNGFEPNQPPGSVNGMQVEDDTLKLFGGFIQGEDVQFFPLALWDSTQITYQFSTNHWGGFRCSAEFQSNRYFGGNFWQYLDNDSLSKITRYDGNNFHPVGNGICTNTDNVNDMEVFNGRLIVGGDLSHVDCNEEIYWSNLASWTGSEWLPIGGAWGGSEVEEMIIWDNKLWVLGLIESILLTNDFNDPDQILNIKHIAWWDGTVWGEPMDGLNERTHDAVIDSLNNKLIVCGGFTATQGNAIIAKGVAAWDGTAWETVGDNLTGEVFALEWYRGQLYAAGHDILDELDLAYFDGYHWQPVPGAVFAGGGPVELRTYKGELYISGGFEQCAGLNVPGLIRYYLHPDSVQWGVPDGIAENADKEQWFTVFPNPATSEIQIVFKQSFAGEIIVTDMQGKQIERTTAKDKQVNIICGHLAKGMYLVHAFEKGKQVQCSKVRLE
ncbi:MAG: T9SS type A sorting domain-containing protein [Flavobacteriales bacterium]